MLTLKAKTSTSSFPLRRAPGAPRCDDFLEAEHVPCFWHVVAAQPLTLHACTARIFHSLVHVGHSIVRPSRVREPQVPRSAVSPAPLLGVGVICWLLARLDRVIVGPSNDTHGWHQMPYIQDCTKNGLPIVRVGQAHRRKDSDFSCRPQRSARRRRKTISVWTRELSIDGKTSNWKKVNFVAFCLTQLTSVG